LILTAVKFVRVVRAFRGAATVEVSRNAVARVAPELVGSASANDAVGCFLVRAVGTVAVTVAQPRLVDAAHAVHALEFTRAAVRVVWLGGRESGAVLKAEMQTIVR
jgi:hypothetical protein